MLNVFGVIQGESSEQIADANITGALGELGVQTPWANDGVGINVGWRISQGSALVNPDTEFQTGDLTGQGAPTVPISGNFHVNELFGEIQVPIVQHNFIDELSVGAGYRKSWYKTEQGRTYDTDTYKLSAEFAPIADIRFRGSYNRAVARAEHPGTVRVPISSRSTAQPIRAVGSSWFGGQAATVVSLRACTSARRPREPRRTV